jgi:purine-binding chemotaxis protein CheW
MEKQIVVIKLRNESFGIDIGDVEGIIKLPVITKVPRSPEDVVGITNLRGAVLPVFDLQERFWGNPYQAGGESRVVIITQDKQKVGIIVDAVTEVMTIDDTIVESAPSMVSSVSSDFITGIARIESGLVILLDVRRVLSGKETQVTARAALPEPASLDLLPV